MQEKLNEIIHYFKVNVFGPSASQKEQEEQTQAKRTHVKLADKLGQVSTLVDSCPGIIETVEKAKFIVNNAPVGTRPAGKKVLLDALIALESIQQQEPQLIRPLKLLRPLVYEYLDMENPHPNP